MVIKELLECLNSILKDYAVCEYNEIGNCIKRKYFDTQKEAEEYVENNPGSKWYKRCDCGRFCFENPNCDKE